MRRTMIAAAGFFGLAGFGSMALDAQSGQHPGGPPAPAPAPPPLTISSRPQATGGEKLFLQNCAMCHGPGGMGTGLLSRRVEEPLLEKRTDLTADYVIQAARMGIGNMPAIKRGEVSDPQMKQIADYLAAPKPGAAK
jgi:mono/diheme cytochrome c family protein